MKLGIISRREVDLNCLEFDIKMVFFQKRPDLAPFSKSIMEEETASRTATYFCSSLLLGFSNGTHCEEEIKGNLK